jgi:hypothetical protein
MLTYAGEYVELMALVPALAPEALSGFTGLVYVYEAFSS